MYRIKETLLRSAEQPQVGRWDAIQALQDAVDQTYGISREYGIAWLKGSIDLFSVVIEIVRVRHLVDLYGWIIMTKIMPVSESQHRH